MYRNSGRYVFPAKVIALFLILTQKFLVMELVVSMSIFGFDYA